jgi:hypothetical protein
MPARLSFEKVWLPMHLLEVPEDPRTVGGRLCSFKMLSRTAWSFGLSIGDDTIGLPFNV